MYPTHLNAVGLCFAAGTLVWLGDATTAAIETLPLGGRVQREDRLNSAENLAKLPAESLRLVRFTHIAHDLLDVFVEGLAEPIRCTEQHPFWSVTRQAWLAANALQTGELLDIGNRYKSSV